LQQHGAPQWGRKPSRVHNLLHLDVIRNSRALFIMIGNGRLRATDRNLYEQAHPEVPGFLRMQNPAPEKPGGRGGLSDLPATRIAPSHLITPSPGRTRYRIAPLPKVEIPCAGPAIT